MSVISVRARVLTLPVAILVVLAAATMLGGCSSKPAAPTVAQTQAACFENQTHIKQAMDLFYADSQMYPPIETVVEKLHVACPSGGTYSFDPDTNTVTCSVHGHP